MKQENNHMFIQDGELVNSQSQTNLSQQGTSIKTDNSSEIIKCARCGAEMKKFARYCMKCGNLNYNNQENEFMKQYAINNIKYKDYTGGLETAKNNGLEVPEEVVTYPYRSCLVTNIFLFIISLLAYVGLMILADEFNLIYLITIIILLGISFTVSYAYQRILIKAGSPWWSVYIPLYNLYIYFKVALGNGWLFLLLFLPFIDFIVAIMAEYELARRFNKSGWLMILFPFIMIPIIGFSKEAVYTQEVEMSLKNYKAASLDNNGKSSVEKKYRAKKTLITLIFLIIIVCALWFGKEYIIKAYEFFLEQLDFFK